MTIVQPIIDENANSLFALSTALAFPFSLSLHIPFQVMQVKFDELAPQRREQLNSSLLDIIRASPS